MKKEIRRRIFVEIVLPFTVFSIGVAIWIPANGPSQDWVSSFWKLLSGFCIMWAISRYYFIQEILFLQRVRWLKEGVLDNREISKIIKYAIENAPDFMGYTHDNPTKNEATREQELVKKFLEFYGVVSKLQQLVNSKRNQKNTSADWISFVDTLQYDKYLKQYDVILGEDLASFMKGEKMLAA